MPGRRHGHEFRYHAARVLQMLLTVARSASQSEASLPRELCNDQLDLGFLKTLLACCSRVVTIENEAAFTKSVLRRTQDNPR